MRLEERTKATPAALNEGAEVLLPQEFDRIDMFASVVVLDMSYSDCP